MGMYALIFFLSFGVGCKHPVTTAETKATPSPTAANAVPTMATNDGYSNLDLAGKKKIEQENLMNPVERLQEFVGLFDFDPPKGKEEVNFEWVTAIGGRNIREPEVARELALRLQKYVYEGWFENVDVTQHESHFRSNAKRHWCQTPWINGGKKGREALHGMTKEFPIHSTEFWPDLPGVQNNPFEDPANWGTAFFNTKICGVYSRIFGANQKNSAVAPDFTAGNLSGNKTEVYPDGSVSFKLLFSSMMNWENYEKIKGAYSWKAHVSGKLREDARMVRRVPHIQMDISFKDAHLNGTSPAVNNWGMTTFTFVPDYDLAMDPVFIGLFATPQESRKFTERLPIGIRRMKAIGLQYGLSPGETVVFDGMVIANNQKVDPNFISNTISRSLRLQEQVREMNGASLMPDGKFPANRVHELLGSREGRTIVDAARLNPPCDLPYNQRGKYADYIKPVNKESFVLNGPADNPVSGCMNCHATSGLAEAELTNDGVQLGGYDERNVVSVAGSQIPVCSVPGIYDNMTYAKVKKQGNSSFDFNLQVKLAQRQYKDAIEQYLKTLH